MLDTLGAGSLLRTLLQRTRGSAAGWHIDCRVTAAMARVIEPPAHGSASSVLAVAADLIPIEAITLYAVATAVGPVARSPWAAPALVVGGVTAGALFLHLAGRRGRHASLAQHLVAALTFIAWAFAIGNPFAPSPPVERWIPALAIVLIPLFGAFLFPTRHA